MLINANSFGVEDVEHCLWIGFLIGVKRGFCSGKFNAFNVIERSEITKLNVYQVFCKGLY